MGEAQRIITRLRGLWGDRRGGIAVMAAVLLPAVCLLGAGGIDVANVYSAKSQMQDAADASALILAKQVGVSSASAISARADGLVRAEMGTTSSDLTLDVSATVAS